MSRGLLVLLLALPAFAAERPRLGVVLVVDQLGADAFNARLPHLKGGLKRLAAEGLKFHELRFESAPSVTSAGHATLMTGAWPEAHGVPANEWFDWDTGKPRYCVQDEAFTILGRGPGKDGTAPTALRAPTLSETLKAHLEGAKAVVISGKERSAILAAGHAADAVVWFDNTLPFFTSSTFYAKELPAWVAPTNDALAKELLARGLAWGLPGGGYTGKSPEPPRPTGAEKQEAFAELPASQPVIDRLEVDLALAAAQALSLGKDDVPDLLTISFSGHDRVGHAFGTGSPELNAELDVVDAEVGRLLDALDKSVGKGRYVVVLTADHGSPPTAEVSKARGLDAGRVDTKALLAALDAEADAALGPADWFAGYKTPGYFAAPARRAKLLTIAERLRRVAAAQPGVHDLLPYAQLVQPGAFGSLGELYRRGAVPGRSPDFILVPKPYWIYGTKDRSGHSTPWLFDRAVPLVVYGTGVKKGEAGVAEAVDVAPTLSRLLQIPTPAAARGRPIEAVFR